MKTVVDNSLIAIENPSDELLSIVKEELVYKDKAKQYQLKRMSRNTWSRNSPLYKQLQQEVEGKLYELNGNTLTFSSCFFNQYKDLLGITADKRILTGKTVSLPWVKKGDDMRDYQAEAVDLMMANYRGLINFATGLGKTLVALHFVKQYRKRTLIVCPSDSIAKQFYKLFVDSFGKNKVGFYGGGKKTIADITIGIAASVTKNIDEFTRADLGLIIFDETHHTPATTFFQISSGLSNTGKIFGLTATDYRSDGKDVMITAGCGTVLVRRDIKWGVENKWLAEPYFIVREVPTVGRDIKDDKGRAYKEHVLNSTVMKDRIYNDALKLMATGKSVLILVDEVAQGKELSERLKIPFATGLDKKSQDYIDQLNKGKVPGLVGTDSKIGEGTDTKNVDALILANFAASKGPVTQAVGRGLRKQGAKTKCLILDYIPMGSTMLSRHGRNRVKYYEEISDKVKVISDEP
jgi:superfamily II DNA or RNA helicase